MSNIKMFEIANRQSLLGELTKVDGKLLKSYKIDKSEWDNIFKEYNLNPDNVYLDKNDMFNKMLYLGEYVASEIYPDINFLRSEFGGLPKVVAREKNFKKMFDDKDYSPIFFSEYNPMPLYYFLKNYELIDKDSLYTAFISMYQTISYGFDKIPKEIYEEVFKYAPSTEEIIEKLEEDMIDDKLKNDYNVKIDEDTPLVIYRSQGDKSLPLESAYSWSLDLGFIRRYTGFNNGVIYSAKVKVKDIIDYLPGGEKEVLVPFDKLYDVSIFNK